MVVHDHDDGDNDGDDVYGDIVIIKMIIIGS